MKRIEDQRQQEQVEPKPLKPFAVIKDEVNKQLELKVAQERQTYFGLIECALKDLLLGNTGGEKYMVGRSVWLDGKTNELILRRDHTHYLSAFEHLKADPGLECRDDEYPAMNGSVLSICRVKAI